jgi:hypothetical protein
MSTSEKLEKVNRIRTDNGIGKRQRTKEQTPISKTLHRKLTMTPIKARGNRFSDVHMLYSIDIYLIEAYGCFFQK